MKITRRQLRQIIRESMGYDPMGYEAWVEEHGHITPAASSVIASYLIEFGFEPDSEEARRLAQEYGVDLRNISMAVRRERVSARRSTLENPSTLPGQWGLSSDNRRGVGFLG